MNINVQQQNFNQVDHPLEVDKKDIEDVEEEAKKIGEKLKKNPEEKDLFIKLIEKELFPNKENNDEQPKTNESYKQEQQEETQVLDNQGWANLNKEVEDVSQ